MNQVDVVVEVVFGGEEYKIHKSLFLPLEEAEALLPNPPKGGAGWAFWGYADEITSKIVADELLQECSSMKENSNDLKALGVARMKVVFSSEALKRSNTATFIA